MVARSVPRVRARSTCETCGVGGDELEHGILLLGEIEIGHLRQRSRGRWRRSPCADESRAAERGGRDRARARDRRCTVPCLPSASHDCMCYIQYGARQSRRSGCPSNFETTTDAIRRGRARARRRRSPSSISRTARGSTMRRWMRSSTGRRAGSRRARAAAPGRARRVSGAERHRAAGAGAGGRAGRRDLRAAELAACAAGDRGAARGLRADGCWSRRRSSCGCVGGERRHRCPERDRPARAPLPASCAITTGRCAALHIGDDRAAKGRDRHGRRTPLQRRSTSSRWARSARTTVTLSDLPMFHTIGLIAVARSTLMVGGTLVLSDRFVPARTLDDARRSGARRDALFRGAGDGRSAGCASRRSRPTRSRRYGDLRRRRAARAGPDRARSSAMGVPLVNGYGMSEAGTAIHVPIDRELCGGPPGRSGCRRRISRFGWCVTARCARRRGGRGLAAWARRSPRAIGGGRQETAAAFVDGWYRTGDLARREPDGLYRLVDRLKDMYVSGGENVFPAEVEAVLAAHPDVCRCRGARRARCAMGRERGWRSSCRERRASTRRRCGRIAWHGSPNTSARRDSSRSMPFRAARRAKSSNRRCASASNPESSNECGCGAGRRRASGSRR